MSLESILANGLSQKTTDAVQQFLVNATEESTSLVSSRQMLSEFIERLTAFTDSLMDISSSDSEALEVLWRFALSRVASRQVAFEEQVSTIRWHLGQLLEAREDWSEAARVLMAIPMLDSGHRHVEPAYKLRIYVRIVQLLLEDEDSVTAESYLNRASLLIPSDATQSNGKPDEDMTLLTLQFKASQARLLDFKRQFQQAAQKYLALSYITVMAESERVACLVQAVTCACLAPAGPGRSRLLATLYKDDRVRENPEVSVVYYPVLEKMYLDRILRAPEISEFRQTLKPHHLATLSDNTTVLDRAVIEHNVLAASKIYTTILFTELPSLLGLASSPEPAAMRESEAVVSRMIGEGRVEGRIDQVEGVVYFDEQKQSQLWSDKIRATCVQVDSVMEDIAKVCGSQWVAGVLGS